jgi:hypothetical protein
MSSLCRSDLPVAILSQAGACSYKNGEAILHRIFRIAYGASLCWHFSSCIAHRKSQITHRISVSGEQPVTLGRDFRTLVARENEIGPPDVKIFQILVKHRFSERMDLFESIGMDEDFIYFVSAFPQHAEQLVSRAPVEIALETQMQAVAVPVNHNSEISGHCRTSFPVP